MTDQDYVTSLLFNRNLTDILDPTIKYETNDIDQEYVL